jgi:Immunity protein 58
MSVLSNPRFLWIVIAISIASCLSLAYLWIDRSISLSYMSASNRTTEEARDQAFKLLAREWSKKTPDEVFAKLALIKEQSRESELVLKRELPDNTILFGNLRFKFINNQLIEVL